MYSSMNYYKFNKVNITKSRKIIRPESLEDPHRLRFNLKTILPLKTLS